MNATIKLSPHYFGRMWTLVVETKTDKKEFILGQDEKVCRLMLGLTSGEVVKKIGTNDINEGTLGNRKLAKFICDKINLNGWNMKRIQAWELCVE